MCARENLVVGDMSATTTMARFVSVLSISFPEMTERLAAVKSAAEKS